jgi:HEAT repeat protein
LIGVLNDPEYSLQQWAVDGLAGIGAPAVEPLITALKNSDAKIRWRAAQALVKIDQVLAAAAFMDAYQRGDVDVVAGAYAFFIQKGIANSEPLLIQALEKHGEQFMAVAYLNCGNNLLIDAATKWAEENNYRIISSGYVRDSPIWGSNP